MYVIISSRVGGGNMAQRPYREVLYRDAIQTLRSAMTSKEREEHEGLESRDLVFFPEKSVSRSKESGTDVFGSHSKVQLKLVLLILTYVFSQDDQKLSRTELKRIKNVIKSEAQYFTSDDLIEVYDFFNFLPDIDFVLRYMDEFEINSLVFNKAIKAVSASIHKNEVYKDLLKELVDRYNNSI